MNKVKKVVALSLLLSCMMSSVTQALSDDARAKLVIGGVVAAVVFVAVDGPKQLYNLVYPAKPVSSTSASSQQGGNGSSKSSASSVLTTGADLSSSTSARTVYTINVYDSRGYKVGTTQVSETASETAARKAKEIAFFKDLEDEKAILKKREEERQAKLLIVRAQAKKEAAERKEFKRRNGLINEVRSFECGYNE